MRILALAPHTDDVEFSCGGSVTRWAREGNDVSVVSFSCGTADSSEFLEASLMLGVCARLENFPTRKFKDYRQDILDLMITVDKSYKPDLVLIPSTSDTHQDHQVIRDEGFRAFKRTSLIGYEMPQNNLTFQTNLFVRLKRQDLDKKIAALGCYRSQENRPYLAKEFIEGLARVRGMQAGCEFAESYEVMRWML